MAPGAPAPVQEHVGGRVRILLSSGVPNRVKSRVSAWGGVGATTPEVWRRARSPDAKERHFRPLKRSVALFSLLWSIRTGDLGGNGARFQNNL